MSWDRVERLIGTANLTRLAEKRVAVIGLGSGGGFVALTLAMSGVGKFVLFDDDVLDEANLVRHVADRRYLGQPKAEAVADLIRQRNPTADIRVVNARFEEDTDALDGVDVIIAAVDGENPKYAINQAALQHRLITVYAGVYERGEGGDVVIIRPYDGPCYACWAAELREELASVKNFGERELDYGMIGESGTLEAEPGLWLHVTRVASAQADLALNELLNGTEIYKAMPGNTVILANTALEIIDGQMSLPYTAVWATIERNPDCLICGDYFRQQTEQSEAQNVSLDDLMQATGMIVEDEKEQKS
ncbi:MAG: ThiF family adenylyltransferase [Anaerolinea sp.]|nr:ThiF family adenylyltransferase [Anaerolinea sp.]